MALIKCAECGGDISGTAQVCPHCGYRTAYGRKAIEVKWFCVKRIVAVTLLLIGLVLIAGNRHLFIELCQVWIEDWDCRYLYDYVSYLGREEREVLGKVTYGVLLLIAGLTVSISYGDKIREIAGTGFNTDWQPVKAAVTPMPEKKSAPESGWKCDDCGEINEERMDRCQYCGSTKNFSVSQKK